MSQFSVKFHEDKRHAVYARDGYKCQYCGHHDETKSGGGLSIDHITAREAGGDAQAGKRDPADNLITTCGPCNYSKQAKSPRAFNAYLKAKGKTAIDWSAVRAQAKKKIDIATGEKNAAAARAFREKSGEPIPSSTRDGRTEEPKPDEKTKVAPTETKPEDKRDDAAKSDPREKKPDEEGPGIRHGDDGKFLPGPKKATSVAFARAIEASAEGAAPTAARLWRAGWNKTDKGDLKFTPRSAKLVMEAFEARGNPLAFYYEHEDRIPLAQRGGAPMKGVCSAPSSQLGVRDSDTGPECWAEDIAWTAEAKRQIETGERRQISPIAAFDEETREIIRIENVSLCAEGATHSGTLLASAGKVTSMDELIQKLLSACEAGDFDMAKSIIAELEAMDGGGPAAMMAKALLAKYSAGDEKKDPPVDDVATKKLAASPALAASRSNSVAAEAFSRDLADLRARTEAAERRAAAAERNGNVGRVEGIIAANRDAFDPVDEREHLAAADPDRTRKHVESIARKRKEGLLVAGKDNGGGAKPPKGPETKEDPTHGLSPIELATAAQHNVTPEAFAKSKAGLAKGSRR